MKPPRTRYTRSGEFNIAFQTFGDGPLDLVFVPGFVTNLDIIWDDAHRAGVLRRMASWGRVVTFDKRNTGLSDRTLRTPTLEERMDDIRAVMDEVGFERAAIIGYSEGGPLSLLFAATYPERVSALVLGATYATPVEMPELEELLALAEEYWGTGLVMQFFDPSVDVDWAARLERGSSTPRGAMEILRANAQLDVSLALPAISVPTLVVHRTGDPLVPIGHGRALAEGIEGAQFVEFAGNSHLAATQEQWNEETEAIEEFLTGARHGGEPDRVLATVLFTDVVESTERLAEMGDSRWRLAIEQLQDETARLVKQFRGQAVKSTGDGMLATFDGPARAVRCASALVERGKRSGLPIRAGLHTGEIEIVTRDIAGIAVHLAKRVESAAAPGRVWVSQTVRDLVTGSGIDFEDRGGHVLKGVPGEWRLYEVASV